MDAHEHISDSLDVYILYLFLLLNYKTNFVPSRIKKNFGPACNHLSAICLVCILEAVFVNCCVAIGTNQSFVQKAMWALFIPRADIYIEDFNVRINQRFKYLTDQNPYRSHKTMTLNYHRETSFSPLLTKVLLSSTQYSFMVS